MFLTRIKQYIRFQKVKDWYGRNERYLIPGALALGIISDFLLFRYIDITTAFSVLTFHLILSGITIAYIHIFDARENLTRFRSLQYVRLVAPLVIQYTFGALLSGFFIFYWFSGVFSASWPFILIIVFLMVSNDILKKYYLRATVQMSVYFFILFSWAVLILPVILKSISPFVFLLGGVASLVIISVYLWVLSRFVPTFKQQTKYFVVSILSIFAVMNIFYFTNAIPPIPLSVREVGVYHSVTRAGDEYVLLEEKQTWWEALMPGRTITVSPGKNIYVFSALFAPTQLRAHIVHHWQYYDERAQKWTTLSRVPFPIVGGRDGGYRGYSLTSQVFSGRYRVRIETSRGQIVGVVRFNVITDGGFVELEEKRR